MIMMIPTQVTALGFIKLITGMGLMDSFIPLIVPAIASPVTFFYMKQYMESALPLSLIEAARIDGSGEFRMSLSPITATLYIEITYPFSNQFIRKIILFTGQNNLNCFKLILFCQYI